MAIVIMDTNKHIVLFGAGKSATVLIDYLKQVATTNNWKVTVADSNLEMASSKVGEHAYIKAIQTDIQNAEQRKQLIKESDLVISMMPAFLHNLIAFDCVAESKHLLTASYVDDEIKTLQNEIKSKGLIFLCEMGLDPGIDHMSAMKLFHEIKNNGGTITSFKSHCGGLIAPESDDNPWHYKISWNPRNIVLAGKAGAHFKENGKEINLAYEELFNPEKIVQVPECGLFAYYPNRDSLSYASLYEIENAATFVRTTLRHPDFSFGWKNIIDLKLTDEEKIYETDGMSVAQFFKLHFQQHGFNEWLNQMLSSKLNYAKQMMEKLSDLIETENKQTVGISTNAFMMVDDKGELNAVDVDNAKNKAAETVALKMHEANLSMKQLFFLGLEDETPINKGICSAADVLQFIAERKLALQPEDKDMIVMLHEIEFEQNGEQKKIESSLVVKGDNSLRTAMAKTVGLPLGIAAKLILEGAIQMKGVHIPIHKEIYNPVLKELESFGIHFNEKLM